MRGAAAIMKILRRPILFALLLSWALGARGESIKLLTVGNSFADNATRFLPQIAKSQGVELVLFKANLPAAELARHARHLEAALADPKSKDGQPYVTPSGQPISLIGALELEKWNFVTIQQWSVLSFDPSTYEPHAGRLVAAIRSHAPSAEILVHQTWAYRADDPWFAPGGAVSPDAPNRPTSQDEMYRRLTAAYEQLAARYQLRLLPVGDAFEQARASELWRFKFPDSAFDYAHPLDGKTPDQAGSLNVGWTWRTNRTTGQREVGLDAHHANVAGCYLAGCIWFETIAGRALRHDAWKPDALTEEGASSLRAIAHKAILRRERDERKGGGPLPAAPRP